MKQIFHLSLALAASALLFVGCCNKNQEQANATSSEMKAPYAKKYTNADFYDAQGNFKPEVAKEAYKDMLAYYDVPFTPFLEANAWFIDFGMGDFENCGMGGVFYVNDSVNNYFSHDIYLLPGQMIPEHKHVATKFAAKMETWMPEKGMIYNFSEIGEATPNGPAIPESQAPTTISKNWVEQHVGEVITLKQVGSWHFMMAGPEGAIVHEYANYHDGAGLRFSNPKSKM